MFYTNEIECRTNFTRGSKTRDLISGKTMRQVKMLNIS